MQRAHVRGARPGHGAVAAIALAILAAAPLSATTLVPADFGTMARESDLILHGTVVSVAARTAGAPRAIETVVTLRVAETIKGSAVSHAVFRVPGGRMGRYRRVMVGAPTFTEGDEVIVFLRGQAPAAPMPYGLSQGVYRVSRRDGTATVSPLVATGAGRVVRGDPARRPLNPASFAGAIRVALSAGNVGEAPLRRAIPRPR